MRQAGSAMSRFSVEMMLSNNQDVQLAARGKLPKDEVPRTRIRGVVDSGATNLVLPKLVADQLGLPAAGKTRVRYANHRTAIRDRVQEVRVELLGREGTFRAVVEPRRNDALIGAIVLEDLDFVVDCITQKLQPRDPKMVVSEIE